MLDLESDLGQSNCKQFLKTIELVINLLQLKTSPKTYRNEFSKAYKILYTDGGLCYLTEILDSAQEGNIISCPLSFCKWRKIFFY